MKANPVPLWSVSLSPPNQAVNLGIYLPFKFKEGGMYSVVVQSLDSMHPLELVGSERIKESPLHPDTLLGKPIRSFLN